MVPSPFFFDIWSEVPQELIGWEKRRSAEEDAQCTRKLPVVQVVKGVKYEPMFESDRSSFFPWIRHLPKDGPCLKSR